MEERKCKEKRQREIYRGILLTILFQFYAWILYLMFLTKAPREAIGLSWILLILTTLLITLVE